MTYSQTHPWIKFDTSSVKMNDPRLCLQLGEIASKCEHLAGAPLKPTIADQLHKVFLAKGALATTAIEGNTLSEEQAIQQVEGTLNLPPSQQYLQQEIQNIIDVCNEEVAAQTSLYGEKMSLCTSLIKNYNRRVLEKLTCEDGVVPGEFRSHSVTVGNVYRGAPAQDCEYLVERMCEWLNKEFIPTEDDFRVPYALVKAVLAHVYLAWIHPFGDGNGRTARLVEFHILFTSGVPLPAAHLLSDHYNKTRSQYYRELDKASKSGGDLMPFIKYATQGFLDGLREQLKLVRSQHMIVAWENYVHEMFLPNKNSPTQKRRRDLVLELPTELIHLSELESKYPRIALMYAKEGERTLQRDLNAIQTMGLVDRYYGSVRAKREIINAFLPRQVRPKRKPRERKA
ncbi:Fic family protein [Prosthecobacter sp. SYSU 5D2]|uniref:Fic family protein n=1 Tax=Prosthecobacter sp. SYSU 5D2 TaxID=3134134 RepID=UPI0031FF339A